MRLSRAAWKNIATLGPVGFVPKAPGTAGTLAAMLFLLLARPSGPFFAVLVLAVTALGVVAAGEAEEALGAKDSGHIVIDEVAGYFFAMAFLPQTTGYFLASFALFRIFDIMKPPPIRQLQFLSGGAGVMADDVVAGVFTNVVLQLWRTLI
ncbi:MAG: phosphatidylglycerophosphatase A [Nitrospirota bacterium]